MSERRVRFEQEATEDLERSVVYYRDEAGGEEVALRFVGAIEAACDLLLRHPEAGRRYETAVHPRLRDVRVWQLADFPYLIFYFHDVVDDVLLVLGVLEGHRDLPEVFRTRWG